MKITVIKKKNGKAARIMALCPFILDEPTAVSK
jgi:hypothetical protein